MADNSILLPIFLEVKPEQPNLVVLYVQYLFYLICGLLAFTSNVVSIVIFLSAKFRKNHVMLAAFSLGNVVAGVAFFLTGLLRLKHLFEGTYFISTTSLKCILNEGYPIFMIIGGQYPALINTFIAIERTIAFRFANWYRCKWNNCSRYILVLLSVVLCAIFVATAIINNIKEPRVLEDKMCGLSSSAGLLYTTADYSLIALSYIFSYVLLLAIFRERRKIKTPTKDELRRQRLLLAISMLSIVFISVPFLVTVLNLWKMPRLHSLLAGIIYGTTVLHSGLSVLAYSIIMPTFRIKFYSYFCIRKNVVDVSSSVGQKLSSFSQRRVHHVAIECF